MGVLGAVCEFQFHLEVVAVGPGEENGFLLAADEDAGGDANLFGQEFRFEAIFGAAKRSATGSQAHPLLAVSTKALLFDWNLKGALLRGKGRTGTHLAWRAAGREPQVPEAGQG